ncbi:MAG: N-acetylmuramoyl-L-alanine amidase [Minisyncoccia bacterium]
MKSRLFIFSILSLALLLPLYQVSAHAENTVAPIKILLVPGHDEEAWGAQYGRVKEANMNLAVAKRIRTILKKDDRFKVYITRDDKGYTKEFQSYFSLYDEEIKAFREKVKKETEDRIENGDFILKENPPHNKASDSAAVRLYGFNKWANENDIDVVLHIHFNDHPRADVWTIGKYTGFAVYVPEEQMANSEESTELARSIFKELDKQYATSTFEKEKGGLVPDQTLIALGSHGSLEATVRSVLVEYGYIYEKKFKNYKNRHKAYDTMAKLTTQGIKNYFFSK